ncbi:MULTISPECIES: condensation domain-containing protein [Sorangium]|uniref:Carrier domain-containing protein n=1 Tax=Sorangium cellulosum TaxID=56 RepID=A0A4P2R8U4_SORCE|nr:MULTISPECIES: condensation domain-containing protein [Sorangium]AUX38593.1 uncharacterized protein SOCE836_108400 [Sorangium cellulosum]WCQ97878.1 hypothetical protein NQZ70_10676 [Sorangium sp. Soce836]
MSEPIAGLADLSPEKRELFLSLLGEQGIDPDEVILPIQRSASGTPVSFAQRRMWFLQRLRPESPFYNVHAALLLQGALDADALERCLRALVERHELLRSRFPAQGDEPVQVADRDADIGLERSDLSSLPSTARDEAVHRQVERVVLAPFDLERGPLQRSLLLKLDGRQHVLVFATHHVVADGWSLALFIRELAALYTATMRGGPAPLLPLSVTYADYAHWERRRLTGERDRRLLAYWHECLAGLGDESTIPGDRPRPALPALRGSAHEFVIPSDIARALRALARSRRVSLFAALLASFFVVLARGSGRYDVAVGTPVANRSRKELEDVFGCFANTLVIRADLGADPSLVNVIDIVARAVANAQEHQELPFERIVDALRPERRLDRHPMFQVLFALQQHPLRRVAIPGLMISDFPFQNRVSRFDLEVHVWEVDDGGLRGVLVYDTERYDQSTVERVARWYGSTLAFLTSNVTCRVTEVPLHTADERRTLLAPALRARTTCGVATSLIEHLEARSNSSAPAVICGSKLLCYGDLHARIRRISDRLREVGVPAGAVVATCLSASSASVVIPCAILAAGGVHLPLDPALSARRRRGTAEHAGAAFLVVSADRAAEAQGFRGAVLVHHGDAELEQITPRGGGQVGTHECAGWLLPTAEGLVHLDESAVLARGGWLRDALGLSEADALLHGASPASTAAVWELAGPLIAGAHVVVPESARSQEPRCTVVHVAASDFLTGSALGSDAPRWIVCSGEAPDPVITATRSALRSRVVHVLDLPETGPVAARLLRAAGVAAPYVFESAASALVVLDERRRLAPMGAEGDLHASGTALARGYLNDRRRTEERFVTSAEPELDRGRLFHLGWRGRQHAEGRIEERRRSARVDWLGSRHVDLENVEAVLCEHSSIADCAAVIRMRANGLHELAIYYVATRPVTATELQRWADEHADEIPAPRTFFEVAVIPVDQSGEIDANAVRVLPSITLEVETRWEAEARAALTVEEVELVRRPVAPDPPSLNRERLLQISQSAYAAAPEPTQHARPMACAATPPLFTTHLAETLADALLRVADAQPDGGIAVLASDGACTRWSFGELVERAQRVHAGLRSWGARPGEILIFQLENDGEIIEALWACALGGMVPLVLHAPASLDADGPSIARLLHAHRLIGGPRVISRRDSAVELAARLRHDGAETSAVVTIEELRTAGGKAFIHRARPDDLALLSLTSGTTGRTKCAELTHRNLLVRLEGANVALGSAPGGRTLSWLPLHHIGAMADWHIRPVCGGMTAFHAPSTEILRDPLRWLDWLERHRINETWAPNFAYVLLVERLRAAGHRRWDLSGVRTLLSAGEQIAPEIVAELMEALQRSGVERDAFVPAWGMTELASGVTYARGRAGQPAITHRIDRSRLQGPISRVEPDDPSALAVIEVGPPIAGVTVRVVDASEVVLPEDSIGFIQVRGPVVLPGYYGDSEATSTLITADGWLNSGDLGFLSDGRLTITGRAKELVIINGANYACHDIETEVERVQGVDRSWTAAVAVYGHAGRGDQLAVFFVPEANVTPAPPSLLSAIRRRVLDKLGLTIAHLVMLQREQVPKTDIGKIRRADLRSCFEQGDFENETQRIAGQSGRPASTISMIHRPVFRRRHTGAISRTRGVPVIIVVDRSGLGDAFASRLIERFDAPVLVETGVGFARLGDQRFRVDVQAAESCDALFATLGEDGARVNEVLYLPSYDVTHDVPIEQVNREVTRIAALSQALVGFERLGRGSGVPMRLRVITRRARAVIDTDAPCWPAVILPAAADALASSTGIPRISSIDLDGAQLDVDANDLLSELSTGRAVPKVAYRGGERWIGGLARVDPIAEPPSPERLDPDGAYLLIGRPEDIDSAFVGAMRSRLRARVIHAGDVDVAERGALERRAAVLESDLGAPLAGILYFDPATRSSAYSTIGDVALQCALLGIDELHRALAARPHTALVVITGASASLGGDAWATAHFAEAMCDALSHHHRAPVLLQSWSQPWSDADRAALRSTALACVMRGLPRVLLGLDERTPAVRRSLALPPWLFESHALRLSGADGRAAPSSLTLLDHFGSPIRLPVERRNETDAQAATLDATWSAFERTIAAIWRTLLDAPLVGLDHNFFELGGESILLVRLAAALRDQFDREVPLVDLFANPTVRQLAAYLARAEVDPTDLCSASTTPVQTIERRISAIERGRARRRAQENEE